VDLGQGVRAEALCCSAADSLVGCGGGDVDLGRGVRAEVLCCGFARRPRRGEGRRQGFESLLVRNRSAATESLFQLAVRTRKIPFSPRNLEFAIMASGFRHFAINLNGFIHMPFSTKMNVFWLFNKTKNPLNIIWLAVSSPDAASSAPRRPTASLSTATLLPRTFFMMYCIPQ
jgi:hypothetical protein